MTAKSIDQVIADWEERRAYARVKGRRARTILGGFSDTSSAHVPEHRPVASRKYIAWVVRRVPEVMVKISGGGKNMAMIKAHFDYISRNGQIAVEDEQGLVAVGRDDICELRDAWAKGKIGMGRLGTKRKEAFNIVFSMPAGTDRESVKNAVRAFAAEEFSGHQYVFASHEDESHSHVHLVVKASAFNGTRLNPRKDDLRRWREGFAASLRDQGIAANATSRRLRGTQHHNIGQKQWHMKKKRDAEAISNTDAPTDPIIKKVSGDEIQRLAKEYGDLARALARGTVQDRLLALEIVSYIRKEGGLDRIPISRQSKSIESSQVIDSEISPVLSKFDK